MLLIGDTANAEVVKKLYEQQELYRDFAIVPESADLNYTLQFVGRHIKPHGLQFLALFLSPHTALHFLQALEAKRLNKPGSAYLLSQEAGRYGYLIHSAAGLLGSGVLIVVEKAETETTLERMEARRLRELLVRLGSESPPPAYGLYYMNRSSLVKAAARSLRPVFLPHHPLPWKHHSLPSVRSGARVHSIQL